MKKKNLFFASLPFLHQLEICQWVWIRVSWVSARSESEEKKSLVLYQLETRWWQSYLVLIIIRANSSNHNINNLVFLFPLLKKKKIQLQTTQTKQLNEKPRFASASARNRWSWISIISMVFEIDNSNWSFKEGPECFFLRHLFACSKEKLCPMSGIRQDGTSTI